MHNIIRQEDITVKTLNSNYGLYNLKQKKWILTPIWKWLEIKNSYVEAQTSIDYWGLFDLEGDLIVPTIWKTLYVCPKGILVYKSAEEKGVYDYKGNCILDAIWKNISFYSKGILVQNSSNLFGIYSYTGNCILRPVWHLVTFEDSHIRAVDLKNGLTFGFDYDGNKIYWTNRIC